MRSIQLAVKATLERFADFVTTQAGNKKNAKGEEITVKDDKGNDVPVLANSRGNLAFVVDGITFEDDNEALAYCAEHKISIRDLISASVNDAKGLAARAAVQEVSKSIPATETVNAETLETWRVKASDAANTAANKTVTPEVSSRMQKAGLEASVEAFESKKNQGAPISDDEKDAFIANVLALRAM